MIPMEVRTRIAPSPTGYPHIGTIYQAMFDFVFAKKFDGKFIVRIEDTDQTRYVEGAEEVIFESLDWFGLSSDEDPLKGGEYGPYRSSERLDIYKKYADQLLRQGDAYYCFCTKERLDEMRAQQEKERKAPMYDKHCRNLSQEEVDKKLQESQPAVIRMKIPENERIVFPDILLGNVEFDSNLIDDQVIIKSDGYPTYHLAATVDDYLMKISHVFRGQEWLPSSPKHLMLYKYLGWEDQMPQFVHLPVILNTEGGGKLSKRQGHSSVEYYRKEGFLPEALLNYLANIVWNHNEGKEIYPFLDLANAFHVNTETKKIESVEIYSQGPRFDLKKLEWINGEYIRSLSDEELSKRLEDYLRDLSGGADHPAISKLSEITPLIKERIRKLSDFIPLTDFFFEKPEYDLEPFGRLKVGKDKEETKKALGKIVEKIEALEKPWRGEEFESTFRKLAEELGISVADCFQLIRIGVSGQLVTPPLFESLKILGEDESLNRVKELVERYPDFPDIKEDKEVETNNP